MAPVRTIICLIVALLASAPAKTSAAERVYFIAADEVAWDSTWPSSSCSASIVALWREPVWQPAGLPLWPLANVI
jgi:hypothetical protein